MHDDLIASVLKRTKMVGACRVWQGSMTTNGAPQVFNVETRKWTPVRRLVIEHRLGEPMPAGKRAAWTCNTPGCIEHCEAMSAKDYMAVSVRLGRVTVPKARIGKIMATKRAKSTTMNDERAAAIRERRAQGATYKEIGAEFGIHLSMAHKVCAGLAWAPPPIEVKRAKRKLGKYEVEHPPLIFSSLRIGSYLPSQTALSRAYGG